MWQALTNASVALGDTLLGWSVALGPEWGLILVGLISAAAVTFVRRYTTRQDWLRRAADDRKVLDQRLREAKKSGDQEAVVRIRGALATIAGRRLGQELTPMFVLAPVIAVLAFWAAARTAYEPLEIGQTSQVALQTPITLDLQLAHLVPCESVAADGWIRQLTYQEDSVPPVCSAAWQVEWKQRGGELVFRRPGGEARHPLPAAAGRYPEPQIQHEGGYVTRVQLQPLRFFHLAPSWWANSSWLPPWLVIYLTVSLLGAALLRRVLRVY